ARQIMQRDAGAPAIRRRPHDHRAERDDRGDAEHRVRARHAEVNQHDDHGNRQPVADDGEGPGVAWVALVDEPAHRAALEVMREAGKDRALAAVRASLAKAAAERGENQFAAGHERVRLKADTTPDSVVSGFSRTALIAPRST